MHVWLLQACIVYSMCLEMMYTFIIIFQNKSNEENELANEIKESGKEKIAELDQMKAKLEKDANSLEETVQGYVTVLDQCVQAVKSLHKKSSEENFQAIEGYKTNYEKVLQDVEHLQVHTYIMLYYQLCTYVLAYTSPQCSTGKTEVGLCFNVIVTLQYLTRFTKILHI